LWVRVGEESIKKESSNKQGVQSEGRDGGMVAGRCAPKPGHNLVPSIKIVRDTTWRGKKEELAGEEIRTMLIRDKIV
jgi:hypothetical protein